MRRACLGRAPGSARGRRPSRRVRRPLAQTARVLSMFLREDEEGNHIAPHLEAGQTLLDLGAGTGFMARWLKRQTGVRPTLTDVVDYHNRDRSLPFIKQDDPF